MKCIITLVAVSSGRDPQEHDAVSGSGLEVPWMELD